MILKVNNVSKTYNKFQSDNEFALKIDSFEIRENNFTAILGPNGSGKSTFIKLILNLLFVDCGTIKLFGIDHALKKARQRVSYLPENFSFPKNYTIKHMLKLFSDINDLSIGKRHRQISQMAKAFNVDYLDKKIKNLSKGMRQIAALMHTFLGERQFFILDEPFTGLDATQKKNVIDYLFTQKEQKNITLLITTHILSDIDKICDKIHLIQDGNIIHSSTKKEIQKQFRSTENYYLKHISPEAQKTND
jgi:ABC-2 type transport system ATP-binding protein